MKKSILALLLAVLMVASLLPAAALADGTDEGGFNFVAAIASANDGDVIEIPAGTYNVGNLQVNKAVSFKGAGVGKTIIVGSINYYCNQPADTVTDITVEDLTVKSPENNITTQQAIWWSYNSAGSLKNLNLNVKNCEVIDYLFGIGVNSSTNNCNVYVENLKLDNVWCGANVSEGAGNTVKAYNIAAGSSVVYAIQVFNGSNYNCYYKTVENWKADTDHSSPDLNSNANMPDVNAGDWPAAAEVGGKYYGTIQKAVDEATSGATITVLPGTYDEVVTFGGKSLTIKAQYPAYKNGQLETDKSKLSNFIGTFNTFNTDHACHANQKVVIEGFAFAGDGLKVGNTNQNGVGNLEVRNCTMAFGENLTTGTGNPYGLLNYFVKVSDDTSDAYATVVVEDNYISGTPESNIIPIQLWHVESATVRNNVINLSGDNGLEAINISILKSDAVITVEDNTISNANGGVYVTTWKCGDGTGNTPFTGNVNVNDNTFACGGTPIFIGFPDGATDDYAAFNGTLNYGGNTNNGVTVLPEVGQKPGHTAYYLVTYYPNNGGSKEFQLAKHNDVINLPAAPYNAGYAFLGWNDGTTTYAAGSKYTVTKDTAFTAVWVRHPDTEYVPEPEEPEEPEVPAFPFYDVPTSAWYYTAVKYVYENKLMDGVDTYEFAPNATLTRAMVWTIIARMSGVDTTGGNSWYAKAQEWVITNGISDGENPTAAITRQELVTMLYRYAQIKGYDVSVGENTNILSYVDATSISEYAVAAFQWSCGSGLTEGDENGALTPLATATRAQAAAMIMRFLSK